ncbi:hypothetical protein Pmani_006122 [Petrolisthes manimaculis]|uniref:Uncharacterized protein n=1 Tax=Petrolisthes manimaculis TaxID=1843537 RepID=A0AAE1QAY3_9EUCA|nr:hypothetical protein Pmani_006122 [Petrolisthes manimaculis]
MVGLAMLAITSAMSMGGGKRGELTANDKMAAIGKFVMEEDHHEARVKRFSLVLLATLAMLAITSAMSVVGEREEVAPALDQRGMEGDTHVGRVKREADDDDSDENDDSNDNDDDDDDDIDDEDDDDDNNDDDDDDDDDDDNDDENDDDDDDDIDDENDDEDDDDDDDDDDDEEMK